MIMLYFYQAVAYFTPEERSVIYGKISDSLLSSGTLFIRTPHEVQATTNANQKSVILDEKLFEDELLKSKLNIINKFTTIHDERE